MMGYPSVEDYKNAIKYNYIHDCPVTVADIEAAEKIFGKDIHALKGKTTRKTPFRVKETIVHVPLELIKMHKDVTIGFDFMYVNSMIWFITVTRKIKFCTVEYVISRSMKTVMACLKTVIHLYER